MAACRYIICRRHTSFIIYHYSNLSLCDKLELKKAFRVEGFLFLINHLAAAWMLGMFQFFIKPL